MTWSVAPRSDRYWPRIIRGAAAAERRTKGAASRHLAQEDRQLPAHLRGESTPSHRAASERRRRIGHRALANSAPTLTRPS
jgi:hypothetical protein